MGLKFNHKGPYEEEGEGQSRRKEMWKEKQEVGVIQGKGHQSRNACSLRKLMSNEWVLLLEDPEESSLADILLSDIDLKYLTFRTIREYIYVV